MNKRKAMSILGLPIDKQYTLVDIKKQYRKLMQITHPDVGKEHFYAYDASEINVAYEYLMHNSLLEKESSVVVFEEKVKKASSSEIRWNAPENPNAYEKRDIYHIIEGIDGLPVGETVLDQGKYIWIPDEEFSLFIKSLYICAKNIIKKSDEKMQLNRTDDVHLLSDITYLLAQQFVDSEIILSLLSDQMNKVGNKKGFQKKCHGMDHDFDKKIFYGIGAMLELSCKTKFFKGENLFPSRIHEHKLYLMNRGKQEIGYLSFKDDRLYYGIIPLFERRVVKVKIYVEDENIKSCKGKQYVDIHLDLKLDYEDKNKMIDSINLRIDYLLNLYQ